MPRGVGEIAICALGVLAVAVLIVDIIIRNYWGALGLFGTIGLSSMIYLQQHVIKDLWSRCQGMERVLKEILEKKK